MAHMLVDDGKVFLLFWLHVIRWSTGCHACVTSFSIGHTSNIPVCSYGKHSSLSLCRDEVCFFLASRSWLMRPAQQLVQMLLACWHPYIIGLPQVLEGACSTMTTPQRSMKRHQTNCSRDHEGLMLLLPKLTVDNGKGAQPHCYCCSRWMTRCSAQHEIEM